MIKDDNLEVVTTLRLPKWLNEKLKKESKHYRISKNALILKKLITKKGDKNGR